jgi:hypothetical protein
VRRLRDERGFAGLELAVTVGLWLFPMAILAASLPTWVERQSLGRLAAQEAAREVVLAGSWDAGTAAGEQMVGQLALNHDISPDDLDVTFGGSLTRGDSVTATVTVSVPALTIPFIASMPAFTLTSVHTEAVDRYRSFP